MDRKDVPAEIRSGDFMASIQNSPFDLKPEEQKFTDCFFGFLDILGYKSFLEEHGDAAPQKIYRLLKHSYDFHSSTYEAVKLKILSDSILLWTEGDSSIHFWNLLNVVELLRGTFLDNKLWLRGGVALGKNFIHHDIIVSPALVQAYLLEQAATFPRVLIAPEAHARGRRDMGVTVEGFDAIQVGGYIRVLNDRKVETDFDGKLVLTLFSESDSLHFVRTGRRQFQFAGDASITSEQVIALEAAFRPELTALQQKIAATHPGEESKPGPLEKYRYVVEKFNAWIEQYGSRVEDLKIEVGTK